MKNHILLSSLFLTLVPASLPGVPVQWTIASGGNGHWYELVSAITIFAPVSFATAQADATSRTHLGQTGYLATVTSAEENAFLTNTFNVLLGFGGGGSAYLGAARQNGVFTWLGGPEAGQAITYTNWSGSYPIAGDDHIALFEGLNQDGRWLSVNPTGGTLGYFVEYADGSPSAVPEPGTWALTAAGMALAVLRYRRSGR